MARRRPSRVRPGELVVLGVGVAAVVVAGLTWADATPWPDVPVRALAAGPGGLGGGDADRPDAPATAANALVDAVDPAAAKAAAVAARDAATVAVAPGRRVGTKPGAAAPVDLPPQDAASGAPAGGDTARPAALGGGSAGSTRPGVGRMCLLIAPDAAFGVGHNGWAVRLADGRWLEGATENNTPNELLSLFDEANDDGAFYVEPGGDADSWMRTVGSFAQVRADFRGRLEHHGRLLHEAGYYRTMRCGDVPAARPAAALATAREVTASGYWIGEDNCLTKAVDVFTAYGARLPDATWEQPNDYLSRRLAPFGAARAI